MCESCIQWENKLATTRIDQLSLAEQKALRLHMQTCQACFALYAEYLVIDDYLQRSFAAEQHAAVVSRSALPRRVVKQPFPWLWQPGLRNPSWLLVGIMGLVIGLIFLPSLTSLPILQEGSEVRAASLSLQQTLKKPRPGATWVHTVSWSPSGKYIAVLWDDSTIQVLDARTGKEVFSQVVGWGYGLAWSPDSKFLATVGREDNTIQLWNISTQRCKTDVLQRCLIYTQHTAQVEAIVWSPDGKFIASASDDGTVQIWDVYTVKPLYTYQDLGSKVTAIAWSPDGKRLVSGDENGQIQAWNALTGAHRVSYVGHRGEITSVSWSSDGNYIASSSYDGTVRIWNVATGASDLILHPSSNDSPVFAAIWSPQSSHYLGLACYNGSVQVWSIAHYQGKTVDQKVAVNLNGSEGQYNGVFMISWSPQGNQLIAGGPGNILAFKLKD